MASDNSEVIVPTKSVFKQDFEGDTFPPEGWTVKSANSSKIWYHGSDYGSKMAMCDHSDAEQQDEWIISPTVDLSQQETKAGIVFDFCTTFYYSVQHHYHNLLVKAVHRRRELGDDLAALGLEQERRVQRVGEDSGQGHHP